MSAILIKAIRELIGEVNYIPYNITNTIVTAGLPPIPMGSGLEYIWADFRQNQTTLHMDLRGKGVFTSNRNRSGTIEIALMHGCPEAGALQLLALTGVPFPIFSTDTASGGTSSMAGTSCRLIKTPQWRRARFSDLKIFTFSAKNLFVSNGVTLPE